MQSADVYATATAIKFNHSIRKREQGEVTTLADIATGMKFISNLTNDDVSGNDVFTTEAFYPAAL